MNQASVSPPRQSRPMARRRVTPGSLDSAPARSKPLQRFAVAQKASVSFAGRMRPARVPVPLTGTTGSPVPAISRNGTATPDGHAAAADAARAEATTATPASRTRPEQASAWAMKPPFEKPTAVMRAGSTGMRAETSATMSARKAASAAPRGLDGSMPQERHAPCGYTTAIPRAAAAADSPDILAICPAVPSQPCSAMTSGRGAPSPPGAATSV